MTFRKKNKIIFLMLTTIEKQIIEILSPFIWTISRLNNFLVVKTSKFHLLYILFYLKTQTLYKIEQLVDIIAIDSMKKHNRFIVNYNLFSFVFNNRLLIQVKIKDNFVLPSTSMLFGSANWLEREVWDMFGIFFNSNKDLRRILTDYGFMGHPLRKDFPVTGYITITYNDTFKQIEANKEQILLQQDRRFLIKD